MTVSRNLFKQGPYNLGRYSFVIGWISTIFLIGTSILFLFPTSFNEDTQAISDDPDEFNYTCAVVGGTLFVAFIYWFLPKSLGGARHKFLGPKRPQDDEIEGD